MEPSNHQPKPQVHPILREVIDNSRGRHWPLRLLLLGWFSYILWHHVRQPDYDSFLGGLNLGIHEFGHLICMPLGEFIGVAGGSIVQCLVPIISVFMFIRQKDFFALSFSMVWLGSNLFGIARYMADSRALVLNLVSPFGGEEVIHDWNYLLHKMGLLAHDTLLAGMVRGMATFIMVTGILWGGWVLWLMFRGGRKAIGDDWQVSGLEQ